MNSIWKSDSTSTVHFAQKGIHERRFQNSRQHNTQRMPADDGEAFRGKQG